MLFRNLDTRIASIHNALVIAMKVKEPTKLKKLLSNSQAGGIDNPVNNRKSKQLALLICMKIMCGFVVVA